MSNRHRGTDSDRAMRNRQIAEALGEQAHAQKKSFLLNFPFVQQNKEEFLRPDELDRKTAFELSGMLDKMASSLSQAVSSLAIPAEAGKLTQGISEFLSAFNRATAYVRLYGRTGKLSNREEQAIQEKFDSVKPSLEQILNAHAAGNPIPEFRAVLNAYDNINNNDLRPVEFSPPLDIPQPAQPAPQQGAPAQPLLPIVGPQAQPIGQPVGQPAPQQGQPAQQGPPQPNPLLIIPADLLLQPQPRAAVAWMRNNADLVPQNVIDDYQAVVGDPRAEVRVLVNFVRLQRAFLDEYNRQLAAYNAAQGVAVAPVGQPAAPPVNPQQPDPAQRQAGLSRADINLIRELEGNRQFLAQAQQALAANAGLPRAQRQDPRQLQDAVDRGLDAVRFAEERAIRARVINIPYDPATMPPPRTRFGRGMYGGVSADMAGMDDEYLDLVLHDGFEERGNWSGMMKALSQMPTHPYGAGIEAEEGEEMPIGVSGSSKRMGFIGEGDLLSDDEEPEEEMEDDDEYDREMAGRGQLDDVAERIQANRQKSELNVAKGGAKNMREMLAKLKSKIKCH
jgi:hypothetical protein